MQQRFTAMFKNLSDAERLFACILGLVFLVVGIAGFIPGFMGLPDSAPTMGVTIPRLSFSDGYGHVFGLFPTNFLHNAIHIVVGIFGIAAATSFSGALVYNRGFAIVYTLIALMGILPATNTTFGLMPIFGNNVWFNALTAIAAAYFGFVKAAEFEKEASSNSTAI